MTKKRFAVLFLVMFFGYIGATLVFYARTFLMDDGTVDMEDSWRITVNGIPEKDPKTDPQKRVNSGKWLPGDVIVYETELADLKQEGDMGFFFRSDYCAYRIFLDDLLLAERYTNDLETRRHIGTEQRILSLPADYANKTLRVEMIVNAKHGMAGMSHSMYGSRDRLASSFLESYIICYASGMFLFLFGGIYLFIIFVLSPWFARMMDYIPMAVLCSVMGIFLHTRYACAYLYMDTEKMSVLYGASMFLIIPIGIVCGKLACRKDTWKPLRIVENIVLTISIVLFFLHILGRVYVYRFPFMFGSLALIMYIMMLIRAVRILRMGNLTKSEKLMLAALSIMCVSTAFSFAFSGFILAGIIPQTRFVEMFECNLFCLGPTFFGYFLLLDFLMNISAVYSKREEYDSLEYLAYSDGLTGIPNRAKYNQYLSTLERKKTDYCIISMDLDGLKYVNDNFGHESGDLFLIRFTEVLKQVFAEDFVARIGGDEFVAVLENDEEFQSIEAIREVQATLDRMNEEGKDPWEYGASAGYAYRHECEVDHMHRTYLLADQRMYEDKKHRKMSQRHMPEGMSYV